MKDREPENHLEAVTQKIQRLKQKYASMLMSKANVVGVGIGKAIRDGKQTDQLALVVLVSRKVPPDELGLDDLIPTEIEGVPVDVQEVGRLKSQLPA
jgi:hypothetical protein